MNEPWRVLENPYPPTVLNHIGKALHLNAIRIEGRIEGLGSEAMALEEYRAAMRSLIATEKLRE